MNEISHLFANLFIFSSCALGLLFGLYNWFKVIRIDPEKVIGSKEEGAAELVEITDDFKAKIKEMNKIARYIQEV